MTERTAGRQLKTPRASLAESIGSGYVAVALGSPVEVSGRPRVGWWRIDPVTGETIGVMDNGLHAGLIERLDQWLFTNDPYARILPPVVEAPITLGELAPTIVLWVVGAGLAYYLYVEAGEP